MRVLGIDPGLGITGYGILDSCGESVAVVEAGVVRATASLSTANRLAEIAESLREILEQFHPEAVAVEELYSHYNHPRTAIIMGHARGVVFLAAAQAGVKVFEYSATRIKKSLTGNGRATKEQVQRMVRSTLLLPTLPEPPDTADALATALCHCHAMRQEQGAIV